jgi:hypothetical protein
VNAAVISTELKNRICILEWCREQEYYQLCQIYTNQEPQVVDHSIEQNFRSRDITSSFILGAVKGQ